MPHADSDRQHFHVTLAVLATAGLAYALLQSLVAPALPNIQHAVHTSETSVSWMLTGYLLMASVATPIVGRLGDMFGKEKVLVIVMAILAAGTFLSAIANSIELLIASRLIQGIGGGVFPLSFGIVRDEFPRDKVAGGIGLISSILGVGGGLGVVLAGVIVDNLGYHWLFWIPFVVVVISAVAVYFFIPESPVKTPGKINWLGAALMSIGITGFLLAITEGSDWGWSSAKTLGLFAFSAVAIAAWVWAELRAEEPLVDMRMMRIKGVWTTNLVGFLIGAGLYASFILVPQLVELPTSTGFGFGASVTQAGLYLLPSTMLILIGGIASGPLEARFGSKPPLIAGAVFGMAAFLLLVISHGDQVDIYVAMGLLGAGIGLAFAAMANLIVQSVPPQQTGVATGMNTVMRTLGGAVGGQITASILAGHIAHSGLPTDSGFTAAFVFCGVMMALAVLASTVIPSRGRRAVLAEASLAEPA
jgi:EmrB/QacA subfamily drug resistance transporter